MKSLEQIKEDLERQFHGVGITIEGSSLIIPKEKWLEIARYLKDSPDYQFDFLSSVTGVDYVQHTEVAYHLYSMAPPIRQNADGSVLWRKSAADGLCPLTIKVRTERDGHMPSVTPIWRSAEYQEREAYDLVGIQFDGHPDLRRILMWEGFQHHPLRKDYVQEDQDREVGTFPKVPGFV